MMKHTTSTFNNFVYDSFPSLLDLNEVNGLDWRVSTEVELLVPRDLQETFAKKVSENFQVIDVCRNEYKGSEDLVTVLFAKSFRDR